MEWKQAFSVGVESIDEQHKRIIHIINQVEDAMKASSPLNELIAVIGELEEYAATHFRHEEDLMARHGFEAGAKHRSMHAYFSRRVASVKARLSQGESDLASELLSFLSMWLIDHISHSDRQLGAFLNQREAR